MAGIFGDGQRGGIFGAKVDPRLLQMALEQRAEAERQRQAAEQSTIGSRAQDWWNKSTFFKPAYDELVGGATMFGDVMSGAQPTMAADPQTGEFHTDPRLADRAMNAAGMLTLGAGAVPAEADALRAGLTWKHPVSVNKLRRPLEEMTATYKPGSKLLPEKEFNFEEVPEGSHFVALLGDRTMGGKRLTGVNDTPFENPVDLQAGSDFLRRQRNPDDAFWASDKGPTTGYQNLIRGLQETGDPVYGVTAAMASRSGDYSAQTTKTLLEMIKQQPLSRKAKKTLDDAMRAPWGKKIPGYPDWPGVDNVTDEYLQGAGSARTKFAQLLDSDRMAKLGGPDVGSARKAVTHPELLDAPLLGTGHRIVKVGDEAVRHITDPKVPHFDYASQLAAKGTTFDGGVKPIPGVNFWADWAKRQKPGLDAAKLQRSFQTQGVTQRKTQEWLDNLMKFVESEKGQKLGIAGAIGAGLLTADEAMEMFGTDGAAEG
jgi:hypothetical protein